MKTAAISLARVLDSEVYCFLPERNSSKGSAMFMSNGISLHYQLDESISSLRVGM